MRKCPEAKPKDSKGTFKVRKVEKPVADKAVEDPKSIRQIRIRFSDLTAEDNDPFIRYWMVLNTMSRSQSIAFLDVNVDFDYALLTTVEVPFGGLEVKLVGGQTLHVAGDKVRIQTEVATTMGKVLGVEEFLVLLPKIWSWESTGIKESRMGQMTQISGFWI